MTKTELLIAIFAAGVLIEGALRPCNVLRDGSCEVQQRVKSPLEVDTRPVQRIGLPMCTPEEFA